MAETYIVLEHDQIVEADDWLALNAAKVETVTIVFAVDPLGGYMDVEALNDTVDEYTFPMNTSDIHYEIDTKETIKRWLNGEPENTIWIAATVLLDWDDYLKEV